MFDYKVITQRDKRFVGGFDPDSLESVLNDFAREGWRLVESVHAGNFMKSMKAEVLFVLEREAPEVAAG